MTELALETVRVSGTPEQMGHAHGETLRDPIRAFCEQRVAALREYMAERGDPRAGEVLAVATRCLAILRDWDPAGAAEHAAVAAAAGVDPGLLYAVANMTDLRDVILLGAPGPADAEGCSAFVLPPSLAREGTVLAGQTWDLNPQDLDHVVAIHREPADGVETWCITCVGCPSLMGMNAHGVALGTTNVKTRGSRPGVGYLSVIHRALAEPTRHAAAERVRTAPRAAAHTYWIADEHGGLELECSAARCVERVLATTALVRTNHCFDERHVAAEGEPPNSSSHARLARLGQRLAAPGLDVEGVRALYADRSDGVDSICRYPEDAQGTATNACLVVVPARREIHACRGPADRGRWLRVQLTPA